MALPVTLDSHDAGVVEPQERSQQPVPPRDGPPMRVRPSLLAEVQRHGKFDGSCLNCGGCSVVCDLPYGNVTFPRRPIHRVVVGARDAVLEGLEPWLCHDCGDCAIACPREADPAASMRTLRRYLTGQYDGTGLASKILGSRAWHLGALGVVAALVFALVVAYHLYWAEMALPDFVATAMPMEHMFPMIEYFTWISYALPVVFLAVHVWRFHRFTMGGRPPALRHFLSEARTLFVHAVAHRGLSECPTEGRGAPVVTWWLYEGSADVVPRRWLKHWLMAAGTVIMLVLTAAFLEWFQTDTVHPIVHPQRWLGYLATVFILWGTSDSLVRRLRRPGGNPLRTRGGLSLPLLLWLTAVSGIVLHMLRLAGFELATHYAYAVHLAICVPLVVVELPFGEWAHMIDRPLGLYFQAVRERARIEQPAEAGLGSVRP